MIQTDKKPVLSDSYGGTVEKDIPDDVVWYDDAFYIQEIILLCQLLSGIKGFLVREVHWPYLKDV